MGMAASQGRLLMLTARKTNLEMRAQTITERRLALSRSLQEASCVYEATISNRHLYFSMKDDGRTPPRLNYSHIITPYGVEGGMGYRLINYDGFEIVDDPSHATDPNNSSSYIVDDSVKDVDKLERQLRNGNWIIEKPAANDTDGAREWEKVSIEQINSVWDSLDTSDDAQGLARYNVLKDQVQSKDKGLDIELKGIENEQKAVETEYESVKKIITSNIEKSYKMFDA